MRVIFDVVCTKCDHREEVFGRRDDVFRCTVCSSESKRVISPVKCQLEGWSGDFPGQAMKWEREHTNAGRKNGG